MLPDADLAGIQPPLPCAAPAPEQAVYVDFNRQDSLLYETVGEDAAADSPGSMGGESDPTPPAIDGFSVSPASVILGGSFSISYTVSDAGGSGLHRVELWRTNDPDSWTEPAVAEDSVSGDGPVSGDFSDTPPSAGDWWYSIHVFDAAGNATAETQPSHVVVDPPDTTPPSPDPSTWTTEPVATGTDSIWMAATLAADPSGVEYYFDEISGNPGATDSGWQDGYVYEDTELSPGTTYTYRVRTRDKSANQNETADSEERSATTLSDVTPPSPDPSTWATAPYATGTSSVLMVATIAADVSDVEYCFHETTGNPGATDSGWQDSHVYEDTELTPGTLYMYEVKTRDKSVNRNEGTYSAPASVATPGPVYRFWKASDNTHFFTIEESEKQKLIDSYSHIFTFEGPAFHAFMAGQQPAGTLPVYRFWKPSDNTHFYTLKESEKQKLIDNFSHVYAYEGPAFYAYSTAQHPTDTLPVYRFWKPVGNTHFFTIKESEKDKLINLFSHVFTFENAVWYAYVL